MTTMSFPVAGQAVVALPGNEPGDYRLVAWSPAVSEEDRAHLDRTPQVSDDLLREIPPRVYFSFYRLPSGGWAFGRRFARGSIVLHTLLLPEEVVEALEWEPRLLPACSFKAAGQEQRFDELTRWDGEIPQTLPDLEVVLLADVAVLQSEIVESRRRFLEGRWGPDGLESALAQALRVLKEGRGLLLPQGQDYEQLLALTWSALPRQDRRTVPWTTHLVPGNLHLFRLANVPDAREALAVAGPSWSLLRRIEDETLTLSEVTEALYTWPGELYDRAVAELRRWLRESPQAVLEEAASFWDDGVVLPRPSILGLAETLAGCGIPADHWMPFALAEATVLDQIGTKDDVQRFSASLSFPDGEARRAAAARLCRRLMRESLNPGAAYRELAVHLAAEIALQPQQAVAALATLSRLPEAELSAWGGPIAAVAGALHRNGRHAEAATLASNWLMQMEVSSLTPAPEEDAVFSRLLSGADSAAYSSPALRLRRRTSAPSLP